jgi:ADP-heptose:LPS heptosyltransferase
MAEAIRGMMISPAVNWAGRLSLDEVGALGEVADLYVGNDAGPTHISAAVGCPTLAIFGPSNPAISGPFATKARVITLWHDLEDQPFSWDTGVTVAEAVEAADSLLQREPQTNTG